MVKGSRSVETLKVPLHSEKAPSLVSILRTRVDSGKLEPKIEDCV